MATQDQIDRAHEWTSENYPNATGADYEARLANALADIVEIDREADMRDHDDRMWLYQ